MAPHIVLQSLTWLFFLSDSALAMPSMDSISFDSSTLSVLQARSEPLEIRGVYGGRKKRYIVERQDDERKCCREKFCLSIIGEILDKDCKCKKCQTGFPALDGKKCDEKCPDGQEENGKGGCCPQGEKLNATGDKCEKSSNDDRDRKGKCPDDLVLDPKEGNKPDDPNPKCQIDDEKNCQKPKLPATRPEGSEFDKNLKVECGDPPDEKDKAKCNLKTHYIKRWVDSNNKVHEECEKTKRFSDKKKDKPKDQKYKEKKKGDWNKDKPEREKKDKARKENMDKLNEKRKKIEEERKKAEKLKEANDKKKARMGKCAPVTALLVGVSVHASQKREEAEDPYDWTTDYFDEAFIDSDDFLSYWPEGVDVETIAYQAGDYGVDADAYMNHWEQIVSRNELRNWPRGCGSFNKRESSDVDINRRCTKRSIDDYEDFDLEAHNGANNTLVERYIATRGLMDRDPNYYTKRNPLIFLLEIAFFAARLGMSLLSRTASAIARYSPRLAQLASKIPDRLFQIAARGAGTPRGLEGMKNAMTNIVKSPAFRKCVMDGLP